MIAVSLTVLALVVASGGLGRLVLARGDDGDARGSMADAVTGLTGLALLTWLAGWLVLAGAYSATAGWLLVALGVTTLLASRIGLGGTQPRARRERRRLDVGAMVVGALTLVLALGRAASELTHPFLNLCDDLVAYYHFPRLILESGGFIEPFNLRRLGLFGAAPFLQSFFWRDLETAAGPMADAVVGQLLLWAAARSLPAEISGRAQPAWVGELFALGALVASLTILTINSMPTLLPMGGALVLLVLTRDMSKAESAGAARAAVAWGLVAAWLTGLRTTNVIFPALLWLVAATVAVVRKDRRELRCLAIAASATVVGLAPWSLSMWRSSGTPIMPLIRGNYRFEGLFSAPLPLPDVFSFVGDCLWTSRVWIVAAIGGLAALRPAARRLSLQIVVALIALVALTAAMITASDSFTVYRYSAPFLAASVLFLATSAAYGNVRVYDDAAANRPLWQRFSLLGLLALWLGMPMWLRAEQEFVFLPNYELIESNLTRRAQAARDAWRAGLAVKEQPGREGYEEAQLRLPVDARVASATEKPFFFRFDRQVLHTIDCPGQVSPPPGMPFFAGAEKLADYLRDLGYTHLVFTRPGVGRCLYSRAYWANMRVSGIPLWQNWAPYLLDFMDNEEKLQVTYAVVFEDDEIVVINLRQPRV